MKPTGYYLIVHSKSADNTEACTDLANAAKVDVAKLSYVDPATVEVVRNYCSPSCRFTIFFRFRKPPTAAKSKSYPQDMEKEIKNTYHTPMVQVYSEKTVGRQGFPRYLALGLN